MISFTPMAVQDATTLLALGDGEFAGLSWTESMLLDELDREDRRWWVAFEHDERLEPEEGTLVGGIGLWVALDAVHVLGISVAPHRRRLGVGTEAIALAKGECAAAGLDLLTLEVSESNAAATAFYRALGFAVEGVRPGYYPDGSGALIMSLHVEGGV